MSLAAHRTSPLWLAALVHRLSGLALATFLPFHFLALGLAIEGEAQLEGFLRWADQPWVKWSEGLLVAVLTVHMLGGLRLLAIENLAWREGQTRLAMLAMAGAMVTAFLFLVSVF
jgi:fumarate reductase subunit D